LRSGAGPKKKGFKPVTRLGIDVEIAEPFPEKPKGMWVRTYGCLLDEIYGGLVVVP
jgi:hypothetical protein